MTKILTPPEQVDPDIVPVLPKVSEKEIEMTIRRGAELERRKDTWLDLWQLVGEFIHQRKQEFTQEQEPGRFLHRELFDSKGPKSAKTSAAALTSMLWPQSVKRIRLTPPDDLEDTPEHKEYYERATKILTRVMDNPKAGFSNAIDEHMLDQVTLGTSGIESAADPETKVRYRTWGIKRMSIAEGRNKFVDTQYLKEKRSIQEVVKEYGIDNVSKEVKESFNESQFDKEITVLIALEPRITAPFGGSGNRNLPFKSLHIDVDHKFGMRHSGSSETLIKVARFWKFNDENYGRSPGMDALPDILEVNALWEAVTIAIEKMLDPPLGVLDDGTLGGGSIDTSASALNVFNISGRAGETNPIFPLFTVGEIKQAVNLIEALNESIGDHFFIDRLLDFNNETQMTLGEAQIRNRLRNATLGSIFSRQISELFSPVIEHTFNILFDQGELGVAQGSPEHMMAQFEGKREFIIPAEIVKRMQAGEDVYNIEYFTPAMRVMQAEAASGISQTYEQALVVAAQDPSILENIDHDKAIRIFNDIMGGPSEIMRPMADVEKGRKERAAEVEEAKQQEQIMAGAEALRNVGQSGMVPQVTQEEAA